MLPQVRSRTGYPVVDDFTSPDGTPIVVDISTGRCYIYVNGRIVQVGDFGVQGFGASSDGTGDATAAFEDIIAASSNLATGYYGETGGLAIRVPGGVYKIVGPITIQPNAGISFIGDGDTKSRIWQTTTDANLFNMSGTNCRSTFRGVCLSTNQNQGGGPSTAINIQGSGNQINVNDCWITGFGYGYVGNPSSDSQFRGNVIEFVATPLSLTGAGNQSFTITENTFYDCGPVGLGGAEFRASFSFDKTKQVIFTHNRFATDLPMSPQTGGYITLNNVEDFTLANNTFIEAGAVPVKIAANFIVGTGVTRLKILDNTFTGPYRSHMTLTGGTDVMIRGNTYPDVITPGVIGVNGFTFSGITDIDFSHNTVGESTLYGIIFTGCNGVTLNSNKLNDGTATAIYHKVYITGSSSNIVAQGNNFKGGTQNYDLVVDSATDLDIGPNKLSRGYYFDAGVTPRVVIGESDSGDNGDAGVTLTWSLSASQQRWDAAFTGAHTVTLNNVGVAKGGTFDFTRNSTGAGALDINGLKNLAAGQWAQTKHNGTNWYLSKFGSL